VHDLRGRTLRNIEFLGEELRRRSEEDVAARMDSLRETQRRTGERFAESLQRESIGFSVFLVLAPLPVLLLGLYRMVLRPISELVEATARARTGDLSFHVEASSRDEIGALQDSFNRMIRDLERSRREIEAWNATLEQRVEGKTSELREALADQRKTTRRLETALTELRDTQGRLIQAEKMASLGNLARSVAHEFNNLLGGILGSAEAALEENPPPGSAEALEVIRRAARRACVVTENLLRFSRRQDAVRRPTRIPAVLDECLALMEPEFRKRGIRIERAVPSLPTVSADAGQVHQVFLNLLTNAAYSLEHGGLIRVEARERGGGIEIRFEDSGPGVPEGIRDRIFEPFFTAREAAEGGTGLGLAVSYGIVTAHGGSIEVEDRPGGGAVFVVTLPGEPTEADHVE
jgi:two-component system NtrC family sensor kinase